MKRFHIHISVNELRENIKFYASLFGRDPDKQKKDYAKWMLDEPAINFAISTGAQAKGIHHLGFQAENKEEFEGLQLRAQEADLGAGREEQGVNCCYALSDKYWAHDPQGIEWENFISKADTDSFSSCSSSCCSTENA